MRRAASYETEVLLVVSVDVAASAIRCHGTDGNAAQPAFVFAEGLGVETLRVRVESDEVDIFLYLELFAAHGFIYPIERAFVIGESCPVG
jgi:hypothetical protein